MESVDSFGAWVRQQRRKLDLTQDELAQRAACSLSAVRKIESDERRPSRQVAEALADALNIPPSERPKFLKAARAALQGERLNDATTPAPVLPIAPPATVTAPAIHMPTPSTPLVGREAELARIAQLLAEPTCRLLTFVGLGGVGKTRLAIQAATTAATQSTTFGDGVYFVALAGVDAIAYLAPTIAKTLALPLAGAPDPQQQLLQFLRDRRLLLVLDNFEHLREGADWLAEVVQMAPGVKLVITSRQPLNLLGEWVFAVESLPIPSSVQESQLTHNSAIALFLQSARRISPQFALTAANQGALVRICQLVEGMPLALELAATWVRLLSCAEIVQELEQSLDFLAVTMRGIPDRHRSLRAVFDHSWRLLRTEEQQVLRRLAVFRGSFSREAIHSVTGASLPLLAGLMTQSLLQRTTGGRYYLHELVRQYAAEQLRLAGELSSVQRRHAEFFLNLVEPFNGTATVEERTFLHLYNQPWLVQIDQEQNNLRAVLAWSLSSQGDHMLGLRLAGALGHFWVVREQRTEGRQWLQQALDVATPSDIIEARARLGLGVLLHCLGELNPALQQLSAALALFRTWQKPWCIAYTLEMLARLYTEQGNDAQFIEVANESLVFFRTLDDRKGTADMLERLGSHAVGAGDYQGAMPILTECLALQRELQRPNRIASALNLLGMAAARQGDYAHALPLFAESLALYQQQNSKGGAAWVLHNLGYLAFKTNQLTQAVDHLRACLRLHYELPAKAGIAWDLEWLAVVATAQGRPQQAARFLGKAELLRAEAGSAISPMDQADYDFYRAQAAAQLGEQAWQAAWIAGARTPLEQMVETVLGDKPGV